MLKNLSLFGEPVFKTSGADSSTAVSSSGVTDSKESKQEESKVTPKQGGYSQSKPQEAAKPSNWEINLGPLSLGSKGVDLKPQLKLGVETSNFNAEIGVGDVRDGLKLAAKAEGFVDAETQGSSLHELHENIHCDTPGFREALNVAKAILGKGSATIAKIAHIVGLDEDSLKHIFDGKHQDGSDRVACKENPKKDWLQLVVNASLGIGASAKVCLGWEDTKGYHMVGVGGEVAQGYALGGNVFAGKHSTGTSMKIILGIGNFDFRYTVPCKVKDTPSAPVLAPKPADPGSVLTKEPENKKDGQNAGLLD